MSENKNYKEYSYLRVIEAVRTAKDGSRTCYPDVTTAGVVTKLTWRSRQDGGRFLTGSLPINNRTKTINSALGLSLPENQEVVWVDVTFQWEKDAERLMNFKEKYGLKNVRLSSLGGQLYATTDNEGKVWVRIRIESFDIDRAQMKSADGAGNNGGGNTAPAPAGNAAPAPAPAKMNQMNGFSNGGNKGYAAPAPAPSGFGSTQFAELDDDGDLPF